jgi:DNA repair exonuclease SbcCD ATPase subunit
MEKLSKGKIKKIVLANFQGHIDSELEFHPNITAIVGESDAGKSSILRSIKWIMTNRPLGNAYFNLSAGPDDPYSSTIEFDDGQKITLGRFVRQAKYVIDGESLKKYGASVPWALTNALSLNDINLQSQHDPYFLLQDTPGNVAKKLNELVNLDIIDFVLKNVNSDIRTATKEVTNNKEKVNGTKEAIKVFKRLDSVEKLVEKLEKDVENADTERLILDSLQSTYNSIMVNKDEVKTITEWLTVEKPVEKISIEIELRDSLITEKQKLTTTVETIKSLKEKKEKCDILITFESKTEKVLKEINKLTQAYTEINEVTTLVSNLTTNLEGLSTLDDEIKERKQTLIDLLLSAKICPFCGCETTKEDIKKHVEKMV